MSIIILEGVVAAGKSTLLEALTGHSAWLKRPTRLVISEHYTERVLELTDPTVKTRVSLLEQHIAHLKYLHGLWQKYRFGNDADIAPAAVFERFHLTHAAQVGELAPFRAIDEGLAELGAKLVFLYHPREKLLENILATEHARNPLWQRWLRSLGTEGEIEQYFWQLQCRARDLVRETKVSNLMLEAYSQPVQELAQVVVDFAGLE